MTLSLPRPIGVGDHVHPIMSLRPELIYTVTALVVQHCRGHADRSVLKAERQENDQVLEVSGPPQWFERDL